MRRVDLTDQELFNFVFSGICRSKSGHYEGMSRYWERLAKLRREPTKEEMDRMLKELVPDYNFKFEAYVDLVIDKERSIFSLDLSKPIRKETIKAGTKMKVVLASNMGDLCLTRDFEAERGYELRVLPGKGELTNCYYLVKDEENDECRTSG